MPKSDASSTVNTESESEVPKRKRGRRGRREESEPEDAELTRFINRKVSMNEQNVVGMNF
jgi:hypothetical protein